MEKHKSRDRLGCPTLSTRVPSRMEKHVYVFLTSFHPLRQDVLSTERSASRVFL